MTTTEASAAAASAAQRTPYFRPVGDGGYQPTEIAAGVWSAGSVSGRIMGGLVGHVVEREQSRPGYRLARLTFDMFRAIPFAPLTLTTEAVRDGGRIRVADVLVTHDGTLVGRATAVFLRPAANPPGEIWQPERADWRAPDPAVPSQDPPAVNPRIDGRPMVPGAPVPTAPMGGSLTASRGSLWIRELNPIVEGRPITGLVRAAMAADLTSAVTHRGTAGLQHINTDWSLSLAREPVGEFVGVLAEDQFGVDGISYGHASLHDAAGPLGSCTVTGLGNAGRADPARFSRGR